MATQERVLPADEDGFRTLVNQDVFGNRILQYLKSQVSDHDVDRKPKFYDEYLDEDYDYPSLLVPYGELELICSGIYHDRTGKEGDATIEPVIEPELRIKHRRYDNLQVYISKSPANILSLEFEDVDSFYSLDMLFSFQEVLSKAIEAFNYLSNR